MLQTPILLLIFNRPEMALQVFEQIRLQQPEQLFIAADGPRREYINEAALCRATRLAILERIDWPCKVETLFQTQNLGCGKAVSTAINWFFSHVEEGIILEDDCIPDASCFSFCSAMLDRYRFDTSILHINAGNYQLGTQRGNASYYFSRYAHVWGWASWRRAWKFYDFTLQRYRHEPTQGLNTFLLSELQSIYEVRNDAWDIQWFMTIWFNKGKVITPNIGLVRNIGYGQSATHTQSMPRWFKKMKYGQIIAITHPETTNIDVEADQFTANTMYNQGHLYLALKKMIKNNLLLHKMYKRIFRSA